MLDPRPAIEIDGQIYELRHRREFSIIEQHALWIQERGDSTPCGTWRRSTTSRNVRS